MRRFSIMLVALCAVSGVRAEWGHGLIGECKDTMVPSVQQGGLDCSKVPECCSKCEKPKAAASAKEVSAPQAFLDKPAVNAKDDLAQTFKNAKVESVGDEVKLTFSDKLFFTSGSAELNPAAKTEIASLAAWLKQNTGKNIRIEGHTDSLGDPGKNQTLSDKRARVVASVLESDGVSASRVRSVGYGETKPVAKNGSEQGRQANRRVEVFIAK